MIELELFTYPIKDINAAAKLILLTRDLGLNPYQTIIDFQYRWVVKFDTESDAALFKLSHM